MGCPTVTDVIIVSRNGKACPPEKTWVGHLPSLQAQALQIDMTGGVEKCCEVDALASQPLCNRIEETLSSAQEKLRQKMGTFHREFDEMCELVLERVKESQNKKDQDYMGKTMESFHVQVGSCCSASSADVDESKEEFANKTNECSQFYLPNEKVLESAFAPKREIRNDFEEQPCKNFLQEVILGQVIQQSTKFASEAYTAFVEQYMEKVMTFFMESSQSKQVASESGSKLLENYMASYENEFGRVFDEMLVLLKNSKKREIQEAKANFMEKVGSSVEDFEDFRTTRSIISKDAYVDMYVGIVVIEARPLLEAMMMPLIQDGADEYQRMVDDALHFYSQRVVVPNMISGGQRTIKDIQRANVELDKMVEQLREQADNLQKDLQQKEIANVALDQRMNQLREQVDDLQNNLQQKDDELDSFRSRPGATPVTDGVRWVFQEGPRWIPYEPTQAAEIEAAREQGRHPSV